MVAEPSAPARMPTSRDVQVAAVLAAFPGSRLSRRRTPQEFKRFWGDLARRADARQRAEKIAAATLERLA